MRFVTILAALRLAIAFAQPSSTISLSNGIRLRIVTKTGSEAPDPLKLEVKPATGNSIYRILRDDTGLAVWAYELVVDRLPDGNHFLVIAKPAGEEFAAKFPNADGGKPTPTLSIAAQSPPLGSGGQFTVEIPTNPGLFQHRSDTVIVQPDLRGGETAPPGAPAEPLIRFADLRVLIGGKPVPTNGPGVMVTGEFAMFYIPTRGGYFFSPLPVTSRPFVQVGDVDRARLKFTIDNEDYECISRTSILTQSDRGQIWVYHDPRYKPEGNLTNSNPRAKTTDQFFAGAADSLNWWLP